MFDGYCAEELFIYELPKFERDAKERSDHDGSVRWVDDDEEKNMILYRADVG